MASHQVKDAVEMAALANAAQRSLDLTAGPLWRVVHVRLPDDEERLLLVLHHLITDGVSWRILLQDLQTAYQAACQSRAVTLPTRTSSCQAWAQRLQRDAERIEQQQAQWWLEQLGSQGVGLPCDNPRGRSDASQQVINHRRLTLEQTARLLKQAPSTYGAQINDMLLAALARALCEWSGQPAVLIQLEGHGREELFDGLDVSRTLGWFNSLYPVRLVPGVNSTPAGALRSIQQQLAAIPDKGIGYGVLRYLGSAPIRLQLAQSPQPQVAFHYLGQVDPATEQESLFASTAEDSGDSTDPDAPLKHDLQLVGQVYEGVLSLRCIYSKRRYRAETIDRIMTMYMGELASLIDHCVTVASPS